MAISVSRRNGASRWRRRRGGGETIKLFAKKHGGVNVNGNGVIEGVGSMKCLRKRKWQLISKMKAA
jgi:hypothetical protein